MKYSDILSHVYLAPPLGVTPLEFLRDLWHEIIRIHGPSYGVVYVIRLLVILVSAGL